MENFIFVQFEQLRFVTIFFQVTRWGFSGVLKTAEMIFLQT